MQIICQILALKRMVRLSVYWMQTSFLRPVSACRKFRIYKKNPYGIFPPEPFWVNVFCILEEQAKGLHKKTVHLRFFLSLCSLFKTIYDFS